MATEVAALLINEMRALFGGGSSHDPPRSIYVTF